ncbi:STAS domain-containing protein [Gemmata sp. JC717]|uniref:STAS domain-containing protein n=1 Tax=Gemmata algarum TaxID=2975278 RepID=UPI0021BAFF76|nr:STAS domain-containing protein [Gemmata algarum]MDY3556492.1 STAS domain-containing protein [Gemmata algarum]
MSKQPTFACQFEFTPDNRAVVIALLGKLDPEAVEELHPQVQEVYRAGVRRFVFDLTHLEYAGSLGLRLLVGLANQVRGEGAIAVYHPTEAVLSMLTMTKLTQLLPVYLTREEALAAV